MCGENFTPRESWQRNMGSPPRVRGKRAEWHDVQLLSGITPACAGKTVSVYGRRCQIEDHPRVCGENPFDLDEKGLTVGSPPHVRGKRTGTAGGPCRRRDHPRVCGENSTQEAPKRGRVRITPACAGKTDLSALVILAV